MPETTFAYNSQHFASAQEAREAQIDSRRRDIAQMQRRAQRATSTFRRSNLLRWIDEAEKTLAALIAYAEADGTLVAN